MFDHYRNSRIFCLFLFVFASIATISETSFAQEGRYPPVSAGGGERGWNVNNLLDQAAVISHGGVNATLDKSSQNSTQVIENVVSQMGAIQPGLSAFSVSSAGESSIGGRTIKSNAAALTFIGDLEPSYDVSNTFGLQSGPKSVVGKTSDQDTASISFTTGVRYQQGNPLSEGKNDKTVFGAYVNFSSMDSDIASNPVLKASGVDQAGEVSLSKWGLGAFGVMTFGKNYVFGLAGGSSGDADSHNSTIQSQGTYDIRDITVSAGVGRMFKFGSNQNKVDVRTQFTYAYGEGDSYKDSLNVAYGESTGEQFSGGVSVKLFSNYQYQEWMLRPFVQVGGNYTFVDEVDLAINGVSYSISDNKKASALSRLGVDFSAKEYQGYLAAEGEWGENIENYSLGAGLTFKLN